MQNKIILVIGRKGTGKSYLVKNELIPRLDNVIILDALNEYNPSEYKSLRNYKVFYDLETFLIAIHEGNVSKAILKLDNDDDIETFFLMAFHFSSHYLIVEEINKYCSSAYISKGLTKIIRYGRHKEINVIGITQRSFDLPKIITSQCDIYILFQQHEPRDIEYLEKSTGQDLSKLKNLNQHNHIIIET